MKIPAGYESILVEGPMVYLVKSRAELKRNRNLPTWQWDSRTGRLEPEPKPLQVWLKFLYTPVPYEGDGSDAQQLYDEALAAALG